MAQHQTFVNFLSQEGFVLDKLTPKDWVHVIHKFIHKPVPEFKSTLEIIPLLGDYISKVLLDIKKKHPDWDSYFPNSHHRFFYDLGNWGAMPLRHLWMYLADATFDNFVAATLLDNDSCSLFFTEESFFSIETCAIRDNKLSEIAETPEFHEKCKVFTKIFNDNRNHQSSRVVRGSFHIPEFELKQFVVGAMAKPMIIEEENDDEDEPAFYEEDDFVEGED